MHVYVYFNKYINKYISTPDMCMNFQDDTFQQKISTPHQKCDMAQKNVLQLHNRKAYQTAVNCCITMLLMVSGVTGGMPFCEPTCHPQKFFQISVPDSSHWWYLDVQVRSDQNPRCLVFCLGGNEQFPSFYWEFFHQLLHKDTNSPTQDFICFHSSGWVFAAAS